MFSQAEQDFGSLQPKMKLHHPNYKILLKLRDEMCKLHSQKASDSFRLVFFSAPHCNCITMVARRTLVPRLRGCRSKYWFAHFSTNSFRCIFIMIRVENDKNVTFKIFCVKNIKLR